jgi:hypothetical protein
MSSKSVKTVGMVVGVGVLAATGFGLAGVGPLAGLAGAGTGVGMGTIGIGTSTLSGLGFSSTVAAGGVGGGFFAGMTGFQAASLGMGALSLGSNLMGAYSANESSKIQQQQIEAEQRRRNLQALQDKATAMRNFSRARGTALAKSAASGQEPGRDMLQEIKKGEEYLQDELGNIAVNTSINNSVSGLQIASAQNDRIAGVAQGIFGGGRSLLTSYRDYNDTRTA